VKRDRKYGVSHSELEAISRTKSTQFDRMNSIDPLMKGDRQVEDRRVTGLRVSQAVFAIDEYGRGGLSLISLYFFGAPDIHGGTRGPLGVSAVTQIRLSAVP